MSKKQTKIQGPVLMTRRFLSPQEPPQRLFTVLIFTSARAFQTCTYVRSNLHAMVFPVVMYGYESWTIKKAECRRIDVFELWCWRRLASPLNCKEIQPVHPKGNQSWIFIGRTEAEAPMLLPTDVKSWLIGKDPDAGKDWRREEQGATEDEMVGWRHQLNEHEFE